MQAAERYLLGELSAADAEKFELHYFECPQCAAAVENGEAFLANARAWFHRPEPAAQPEPKRTGNFAWAAFAAWLRPAFAIPVMAALAAIAIYQGLVVIPGLYRVLNPARSLPAVQLIGASRGEATVIHVPHGAPFASVMGDIPPGTAYRHYVCVLTRGSSEVSAIVAPAPAEGMPVTVLIPSSQLKSGPQELDLYGEKPDGQRSDRISKYPFTVEFD
ncbi:MAG: zf-HC2 domain-containing protein [Acidobacteriota bacterium]|nr:zf-HC2 domain-containing protein [Acidobacteriota bacterium]